MRLIFTSFLFACLATGCVQREEQWAIKESEESAKFKSNYMRGHLSEEEGGTQDDIDSLASQKFSATSDLKSSEYKTTDVESRGFFGSKKKSNDGQMDFATDDFASEPWSGTKDFANSGTYETGSASYASQNWKPRKDEYHHVTDYDRSEASRNFATGEYTAAETNASNNVLVGRANDSISASDFRKQAIENPDARKPIQTPGVSLEEVRDMLGR